MGCTYVDLMVNVSHLSSSCTHDASKCEGTNPGRSAYVYSNVMKDADQRRGDRDDWREPKRSTSLRRLDGVPRSGKV